MSKAAGKDAEVGKRPEGETISPCPAARYGFKVDGPLLGYRASAKAAFDPRYSGYKKLVRYLANTAGIPNELGDAEAAEVYIRVYWAKKARIDLSNVLKAIEDGMFTQDRRICAIYGICREDVGSEYAEVDVIVGRRGK